MENKYHYDYDEEQTGYSYCYPGTHVLVNKFSITNADELEELERNITDVKEIEILGRKPRKFNYTLLRKIHYDLFSDIYEWAGKERNVNISKGMPFCMVMFLGDESERIFSELEKDKYLKDLPCDVFVDKMAYYFAEVNALHPFREGNGRTQRIFFSLLAEYNGYHLDFSLVTEDEMIEASYASLVQADYTKLEGMFAKVIIKNN